MTDFASVSRHTINNFLQSIVFIDDKAYAPAGYPDQHEFDAKEITKVFSKDGKVCAVYQLTQKSDIESLITVAKKADVAVLDWQIVLDQDSDLFESNDEADAEQDDIRGLYTKSIISGLLSDQECQNSIKLILVYTGETDLEGIADDILEHIESDKISGFKIDKKNDTCTLNSNNCRIMVIAKSNRDGEYTDDYSLFKDKKITYKELPNFITQQFSDMTSGLLSNFAMESLSEIRRNFYHIINLFSKELDSAYLAHQTLLTNTEDANELLVDLLGDTFTSIIRYKKLNSFINKENIKIWMNKNIPEVNKKIPEENGKPENIEYKRSHSLLLKLLESNNNVEEKYFNAFSSDINGQKIAKNKIKNLSGKLSTTLFTESNNYEIINKKFANLCYHRNPISHPSYHPTLSLGTVVKSSLIPETYYICIQQRCDSVRLSNSESRRFLFISITKVKDDSKFNFLTPDGEKLLIDKGTYSLRTVKFRGIEGSVRTKCCNETGKKFFEPAHLSEEIPEKFEFIVELKELYAQRILEEYSASLSRVGIDEPEWVRRAR